MDGSALGLSLRLSELYHFAIEHGVNSDSRGNLGIPSEE